MVHRRTSSRFFTSPSPLFSPPPTAMSYTITLPAVSSSLLPSINPRKPRHRTTLVALLALIGLSTYIFFFARPTLALNPLALRASDPGNVHGGQGKRVATVDATTSEQELPRSRLFKFPASQHYKAKAQAQVPVERPQVQLTSAQELAAVSSFLASLPQNVIPLYIDPSRPIDPQLVLDFDTRSPRAADDVKEIVVDVWSQNPVVLYSKV